MKVTIAKGRAVVKINEDKISLTIINDDGISSARAALEKLQKALDRNEHQRR